jgi:alginate O-acetyltransferase complex protein AlgI
MSFISLSFMLFFPIVTIGYFLLPHRFRWMWLLLASCIFYMAFIPAYILILFGLIVVDFVMAILIERSQGSERTYFLLVSIVAMVGTLVIFKYFNFLNSNIYALTHMLGIPYAGAVLSLALPIGLSFHTFQSLSYVIEVYRGKQKAERHFGIYALYVMFYPQLVAGPIERPQQFLYQFYDKHQFEYNRVKTGLVRMGWGFFKKMAVADNLALIVNPAYAHPGDYAAPALLVASICFTLQLYFDFSAYCDIALGAAQVTGFTLMENFDRPFISTSIAEFWRRWHISLSSWFRDYFYYPLVLSQKRVTWAKIQLAVLFTFLVTGFWHGANWTYGIFGLLQGAYIVIGSMTQKIRGTITHTVGLTRVPKLHKALQITIVFLLFMTACIFFRAQTVYDAWYILTHIIGSGMVSLQPGYWLQSLQTTGAVYTLAISAALSIFIFMCEYWGRNGGLFVTLARQNVFVRWGFYYAILYLILVLYTGTSNQFIYFQF